MTSGSRDLSQNQPFPAQGPLLGIDFGTVRVGLAIADQQHTIAVPLATYQRRDKASDERYFLNLVEKERVVGLVIGLPVHMSGAEGGKAKQARSFGKWLSNLTNLPVRYIDERYSSVEAWSSLKAGGLKASQRRKQVDKVAAQLLLQAYLDGEKTQQSSRIVSLNTEEPIRE